MYDLFFDDSVITMESIKSLLDVLGLLNALLLGSVLTCISAVDLDVCDTIDNLYYFNPGSGYYTNWYV